MATKKAVSTVKKSTVKKLTKKSTVKAVSVAKKGLFSSPLKRAPFVGALVAEFIGTFLLATAVIAGQGQPIIILFAVAGIVMLIGALSGAHINPAISIGAWVTRRINGTRAIGYIVAQFLGALAAFGLLSVFVGGASEADSSLYGAPALFQASALPLDKEWYVFFAELIGTAILGLVIATALKVVKDLRVASGLTAGLGIFVALLFAASAASYVGGSAIINPAVALSLQALEWEVWPLAVYVLAPAIGAVIGFVLYDILSVESDGGKN